MTNPRIVLLCAMLAAPLTLEFAADAKPLCDKHCRRCHGINGEGNQKIASMMNVEIRPGLGRGPEEIRRGTEEGHGGRRREDAADHRGSPTRKPWTWWR
jgi:hypothetical protein